MLTLSSLGLTSKLCTTRGQARNSRSVKQSLIRLRVQQGLFKYQYFRRTLQKIHRCEFWRLQQLCFRLRLDQFGEDFHDEGQRSNWRSDPAECAVFIRQNQGVNVVRLRNKTVLHRSIRSIYMEQIFDLLSRKSQLALEIREQNKNIIIQGLIEQVITNYS